MRAFVNGANTGFYSGFFDDAPILQSPLQGVRDGEKTLLRFVCHDFFGKISESNVINWQISVGQESHQIVDIALILDDFTQTARHLKVGSAACIDEYRIRNAQNGCLAGIIVRFVVDKNDQAITKAIYFLSSGFEGARRLRLPDARNFHVDAKTWKINAIRRIAFDEGVSLSQVEPELMLKVGADGFTICDTE
jgi:hypothetical protein